MYLYENAKEIFMERGRRMVSGHTRDEMCKEVSVANARYDMSRVINSSPLPKLARKEYDFAPDGIKGFVEGVSGRVSKDIRGFMLRVLSFNADEEAMERLTVMGSLGLLKNSPICIAQVYSWYIKSEDDAAADAIGGSVPGRGGDKESQVPAGAFLEAGEMFSEYNPDFTQWFRMHANAFALHCFDMMVNAHKDTVDMDEPGGQVERMVWDLHLMANVVGYKSMVLDVLGMHDKDVWLKREVERISSREPKDKLNPDRMLGMLRIADTFVHNANTLSN